MKKIVGVKLSFDDDDWVELECTSGLGLDDIHNFIDEKVKPKAPLIKDEKIRKAVRAWAEANGIGGCVCKEEIHCITFETERGMFISFENADPVPPEGNFTIAELCGKGEE